ncbi:PhnD/SsuA/transferrin family substrate-binding protein [Streptomyces olivaceus]
MGRYPHLEPLRDGRVTSDLLTFDFVDYPAVSEAFHEVVRDQTFDVAEIAIGAYLQAREAGKPLVLLPLVEVGGFQQSKILVRADGPVSGPADLAGRTLGVRSYSQTTGIWARAILSEQFGVDLDSLTWLTHEDSHCDEYVDPPFVRRAADGTPLRELLATDAVAAAVIGVQWPDTCPVITDVRAAEDDWFKRYGTVPVNHLICVRADIAEQPDLVAEIHRMFAASHRLILGPQPLRLLREGVPHPVREDFVSIRPVVEQVIDYARRQRLIGTTPEPESLFVPELVR